MKKHGMTKTVAINKEGRDKELLYKNREEGEKRHKRGREGHPLIFPYRSFKPSLKG